MKNCSICGDPITNDELNMAEATLGVDPILYEPKFMHIACFNVVFEELKYQKTDNPIYANKQDEYLMQNQI